MVFQGCFIHVNDDIKLFSRFHVHWAHLALQSSPRSYLNSRPVVVMSLLGGYLTREEFAIPSCPWRETAPAGVEFTCAAIVCRSDADGSIGDDVEE
jgi:hypothetical protein